MLQNALEMDGQKGVPKRTVINLQGMARVGEGLKVFKAANLVRFVVLQSVQSCTVSHLHVIKILSGGVSRLLVAYRAKQG